MSTNPGYVYILSNYKNTVLYIGVTSDLQKRVEQHRNSDSKSFCKKYKVYKLVYYEKSENIRSAIEREKQLKNWHRSWKINLISSSNPEWNDLFGEWWSRS